MTRRGGNRDFAEAFSSINERPVDDISLAFFYKPHTITLLAVSIAGVIYTAFVRYEMYCVIDATMCYHISLAD